MCREGVEGSGYEEKGVQGRVCKRAVSMGTGRRGGECRGSVCVHTCTISVHT